MFQHGHMGQKGGIVKVFGVFRAFPDAGLALDAGAGNAAHIAGVNGPHGAHPGAGAAVGAPGRVRQRLGFQELGRLAVGALGDVIGGFRVPRNRNGSRNIR